MEKEYDDFYQIGNAKVFIISPERVLGRKMTQEEIDSVLEDISEKQSRIEYSDLLSLYSFCLSKVLNLFIF